MNKQASEAAKQADVVLMADAYVAATKTVQLLNADGLAAVFTAQVVDAMSRGLAVSHSERAPSDDEVALAKAIKDIREAGGSGMPYWPAALEWNPHFGRAWEAALRNCSEIQPDKGDALRRAIAQSRMDDVQEARNLPDIFEIEAAMDKVRARDALPLFSPEPLWWNDVDLQRVLIAGAAAGYLYKASHTQVHWMEGGIKALKAAREAEQKHQESRSVVTTKAEAGDLPQIQTSQLELPALGADATFTADGRIFSGIVTAALRDGVMVRVQSDAAGNQAQVQVQTPEQVLVALLSQVAVLGGIGEHEFSRPGGWLEQAQKALDGRPVEMRLFRTLHELRLKNDALSARAERLDEAVVDARQDVDRLRRALEVIGVGDAADPKATAKEALEEAGIWMKPEPQQKTASPSSGL